MKRIRILLFAARALRGFGDGFGAILLPAYLGALGFGAFWIGAVSTTALLGSATLTLAGGLLAPRYGVRTLLLACAGLMIITGVGLASFDSIIALIGVAFVGTLNPTIGDIGVHVPLEQASLAQSVSEQERTRCFARYSLIGGLAIAAGAAAAGIPDLVDSYGVERKEAIRAMFYAYAALGIACLALYWLAPANLAPDSSRPPRHSERTRRSIYWLAALFSVDSFAGGFAVQSMLVAWLFQRFSMSLTAASAFFLCANLLSALSNPVAAWLARRYGLVNTMVLTHVPSSICLIAAALVPSLPIVLILLLIRSALGQMDVPARTSYVMAMVPSADQTAAASITAAPRSVATAISPVLAGAMFSASFLRLPLLICGTLKITYDFVLLYYSRRIAPGTKWHADQSVQPGEP